MAKKVYIGIDNVAREAKKIYIGVNGVARKIKKGYVGVGGVARPIMSSYEQLVNYTMLYYFGDECEDVTGGWNTLIRQVYDTWMGTPVSDVSYTNNADNIAFSMENPGGSQGWEWGILRTRNPVPLAGYIGGTVKLRQESCARDAGLSASPSYNSTYVGTSRPIYSRWTNTAASNTGTAWFNFALNTSASWYFGLDQRARGNSGEGYGGTLRMYVSWLYKADDCATLAAKAGISDTSVSGILGQSSALLSNSDAVDFMVAQCTGEFMSKAVFSSTFLSALEASPYKSTVYENEHWAKFLAIVQ